MKTTIDWLRWRDQGTPATGLEALRGLFGKAGTSLCLKSLDRGSDGFSSACAVVLGGHEGTTVGRVDFGGDHMRGWQRWNISGKGCEWVKDWDALSEVEALPEAQIRRVDIALTTWHGEVGHADVVRAHEAGKFITRGRPPDLRQILSSRDRAGRTCYVGNREGDKFFRAYEKGYQLAAPFEAAGVMIDKIDGCPLSGIYRCELEIKAKTVEVGFEVVESRDTYFAGSYPYCAELLPGVESDILMRRPERAPVMELELALSHLKQQWGDTLYTALAAHQGDLSAVWDKVCGNKHNQRLLDAGVLLVDHEAGTLLETH